MKKAIIIGATSGIGQEVAKCLLLDGWQIGVAGRRQSALENLQRAAPDQIQIQALDVTQEDAGEKLNMLIDKVGGMDLFLLSSGIGFQNTNLNMEVELKHSIHECRGIYPHGGYRFHLFQEKRRRPPGSHQLHRGNERTWSGSCLLCHQTFPEHLHRCSRTTFIFTKTEYPFY